MACPPLAQGGGNVGHGLKGQDDVEVGVDEGIEHLFCLVVGAETTFVREETSVRERCPRQGAEPLAEVVVTVEAIFCPLVFHAVRTAPVEAAEAGVVNVCVADEKAAVFIDEPAHPARSEVGERDGASLAPKEGHVFVEIQSFAAVWQSVVAVNDDVAVAGKFEMRVVLAVGHGGLLSRYGWAQVSLR